MSLVREASDSTPAASPVQNLLHLSETAFHEKWLTLQCGFIIGAEFGVVLRRTTGAGPFEPVSVWPGNTNRLELLSDLITEAIEQQCGLITTLDDDQNGARNGFGIVYPGRTDDRINTIVAVILRTADRKLLKYCLQQLEWGFAWIDLFDKQQQLGSVDSLNKRLGINMEVLARVLAEDSGHAAAIRLVTELAQIFSCDRVSLGLRENGSIKIRHISHSTQFGGRMNVIRLLENAMDEAVDQARIIHFPAGSGSNDIDVAHRQLQQQDSKDADILTLPLSANGGIIGAMTLERDISQTFSTEEVDICEAICAIAIGPVTGKMANDRNILLKIADSAGQQLAAIFGPGHLTLKLILIVAVLAAGFFSVATSTYTLSADARMQGGITRVIVAPYDGYIDTAQVRAGDTIRGGGILLTLDVRDYHLEKLRWSSEIEKLGRQRQEATAVHDRAAANVLSSQLQQAQVQLDRVEMVLDRAEVRAPFDGLVVSGDLSRRLGGAVSKGELLFEISPLDDYRVELLVPENRIADVQTGQSGRLYLSAIPEKPYPITVTRITPVTVSENGRTRFRVEAEIREQDGRLQIGMEGVGQIDIDERRLIAIWMRDLIDWMRLQFWRWSF